MTLVLLDTNTYLRLAKRIKPMLGVEFGQKAYVPTILKQIEDEVHRNPRLRFQFPWFDNQDLADERFAKRIRLTEDEKQRIKAATSVLRASVLENATAYTGKNRTPPSSTDCYLLAFGQSKEAIVVTDDLGMHQLADEFGLAVWHGHELLKKMLSAKLIDNDKVREIYAALENNDDLTETWAAAKHTAFVKIFGPPP